MPASVQRYFDAMRIPFRAGRFFTQADSEQASSVAIVSESTGRRLWPNQNPIGKRISIASERDGERCVPDAGDRRRGS